MVTVFLCDSYFKDHPDYDNLTEALSKAQKVIWRLIKVSATLQDSPRADRCSISSFYKNPYKPYIF